MAAMGRAMIVEETTALKKCILMEGGGFLEQKMKLV